jgi:flotillin
MGESIEAQGLAEATAMSRRAEAFRTYNEAAVAQMFIDKLPDIAQAVSAPLAKVDRIVMINSGGTDGIGASKLTGEVTKMITQIPPIMEAMTGIKLEDLMKNIPGLSQKTNATPSETIEKLETKA